ncbi:hypothetical protein ABIE67_000217 [Streptomyces sp. V4I8]|jgi:hypothetical protein
MSVQATVYPDGTENSSLYPLEHSLIHKKVPGVGLVMRAQFERHEGL